MKLKMSLLASLLLALFASCQNTDNPYMTLASKTLDVASEGGEYTFKLASNVYYRVNNDCKDWAEIKSYQTVGDTTVFTLQVAENTVTKPRTGTIRFIGDDVTPLKLYINQARQIPKGVDPVEVEVAGSATESAFKVYAPGAWTATCADSDVVISPASGDGETDVKVTFPANEAVAKRAITIKVALAGDKEYTHTITQRGFTGIFADWSLKEITSATTETFTDSENQSVFPGTNGKYVAASTGIGKIEYYAVSRDGFPAGDKYVCMRRVGGNGDPYVSGMAPGDKWIVTMSLKNGQVIPAGTKIRFYFVTKNGTASPNYWMLDYKQGNNYLPVLPTKKITESATTGLDGAEVNYSAEITYNFAAFLLQSTSGAYVPVTGEFVTTQDMTELVFRYYPVSRLAYAGGAKSGLFINQTLAGGETRFSAQHPNKDNGDAVKEYNEHVTFEIVE